MEIIIKKTERSIESMGMNDNKLIEKLKESEYNMYEVFCRPNYKPLVRRLNKDNLFGIIYFWYSCEFGMSLEKLIPEKSEIFKYGTTAKCDMSIDLFSLVWNSEKDEIIELTEEPAQIIRNELIERLTYIHEKIITVE